MLKQYRIKLAFVLCILLILVFLVTACAARPSGIYTASGPLGIKQSLVFQGDTLEMQSFLGGKQVYKYEIRSNQTEIILTEIVSDQSRVHSYKYIKDPACVVIDGIAYYR